MGLLAYDPDRVAFLKQQLATAADELRAVRCGDPAATPAMRSIATIRADIDLVWLPLLTRILENSELARRWWHPLADRGLENSLISVMADGYGWSVQADPLNDDPSTVTAAETRALGAMLNKADLVELVDDRDQLMWLAHQLAIIGRDPALSFDFLANFSSWATLTYVLGDEHARTSRNDIPTVFQGLMSIWKHGVPASALAAGQSARLDSLLPAIADVDPYVQALMLRSLPIDAITLATVTYQLLTNWLERKNDPGARVTFDRHVVAGPNAGDLLLPLILKDPAACVWFTHLAARHPAILFETLNDPDVAFQVVLLGTEASNTTVAAAGRAVLAILDYFHHDPYARPAFDTDGHPGEYSPYLGALVAPWLLQFTMFNDDWEATPGTKAALLRVALRDERAMTRLIADAEQVRVGFTATFTVHEVDRAQQVGGLLNLILQLSVNELVDDEIASTDERLNLLWTVVGVASSFLPGGPLVGIASGVAMTALSNKVAEYLDQPDPQRVRRTAERAMDVALTLAGADAVSRLHELWVTEGKVAAALVPPPVQLSEGGTACPSADYHRAFEQWRAQLPSGVDGELSRQAGELLAAFIGPSAAQSNCAEIAG